MNNNKEPDERIHRPTKEQKELIEIGLQQLANGEVISNEDVESEEGEWLNA